MTQINADEKLNMNLGQMEIIESTACVEQFRFPRSRRRRIRARWQARWQNFKPSTKAIVYGNQIICHPVMARRIREQLKGTT